VGWPIQNVLLDLTGGVCSFLQEFIDAYNSGNYGMFTSNIPKLFLAIETIFFDFVFITQHFVFYRGKQPVYYIDFKEGTESSQDQSEQNIK
jgi:cystinosin